MDKLQTNGFVIIREEKICSLMKTVYLEENNKCNTILAKHIIDNDVLPFLSEWFHKKMYYRQFRVSNSRNYGATMMWHRDTEKCPDDVTVYTCLLYLDPTKVDVVPGSHLIRSCSYLDMPATETLNMKDGDLIIMDTKLVHKTTSEIHTAINRRTVQIFNIVSDFTIYKRMITHSLDKSSDYGSLFKRLEKTLCRDLYAMHYIVHLHKKHCAINYTTMVFRQFPKELQHYDIHINETCECVEPSTSHDLHQFIVNIPLKRYVPKSALEMCGIHV
jgi:hypothetical protein